ncbi:hypothetical protein R3W88_027159 [Solanum pinnatisectum]|uniref:Reverse transcriptase domain-containing protein n=1 Tax=Solanum pinnatisectum TaxID=50273 RepID=A0AAV9LHS1_9SOLN|nr:hypothetical protein R3W88_027159 [Solanum pinnatisectum]
MFADDIILSAQISDATCRTIANILSHFNSISGQRINYSKSKDFFSSNIAAPNKLLALSFFNMTEGRSFGKYLGATLIRSTLNSLPNHVMQLIKVPDYIIDKMECCERNFYWGTTPTHKRLHLLKWSCITQPKDSGGLERETTLTVANMRQVRNWSLNELSFELPHNIMASIDSVYFPRFANSFDHISWGLTETGAFSVKSCFTELKNCCRHNYYFVDNNTMLFWNSPASLTDILRADKNGELYSRRVQAAFHSSRLMSNTSSARRVVHTSSASSAVSVVAQPQLMTL